MNLSAIKKNINGKLVLLLAGFYTLFDIVYVFKRAYLEYYFPPPPGQGFLISDVLFDWFIVVFYMTLIAISTKRLLKKKYSWVKIISIHTLLSILIGIFIRLIFDVFEILLGYMAASEYQLQVSIHKLIKVIDLNFLIYFAMVFIIYTYYYLKEVEEDEKQRSLLETQLVNTRMKMLSSQLQPHFLFNTLNSISVLVDLDAGKAKDTIVDLSDFLREILYSSDKNEITLKKELHTLEYYLNILNIRFSDHLNIQKDIDESLLSRKVPALLLQPLIENSIKHGYSYDHTDLEVLISAQTKGEYLVIKVENNGKAISLTQSELWQEGVGLANMRDRLQNLYGDEFFFEIRNKANGLGVETIVKIPNNLK